MYVFHTEEEPVERVKSINPLVFFYIFVVPYIINLFY